MVTVEGGWGLDEWGGSPWGGAVDGGSLVATAEAIRENLVRITFGEPLLITGLLDRKDSLSPEHYTITAVSGVGLDDEPVRTTNAILIEKVLTDPNSVDVYVDQLFSHYPTIYSIRCVSMYDSGGLEFIHTIDATFYGLQGTFKKPVPETYVPEGTRDLANPTAKEALFDPLPDISDANLGTFPYADDGDYGYDYGVENLKKRVLRRCMVRPGGFVWLQNYGVGIVEEGKKLNSAARRASIKARIKDQVSREPDVRMVDVSIKFLPSTPGIVWFIIRVLTTTNKAFKFSVPFVGV